MAPAQPVRPGFSPLDNELGLLSGGLTPRLQEALVRLSTHIPSFAKASRELAWFTGAQVHADTARRRTEAAGAVLVAYETAEAARILREHPDPPATPDTLVVSVDGAMIPLVQGQWAEVRTLAVGEVQPPRQTRDGPVVTTTNLSYFSRRVDSTTFGDQATGELHRRGIEGARRVGVVVDGAAWCQRFIDLHYPDAVRILDFPHAAEHVTPIAATAAAVGVQVPAATLALAGVTLPPDDPRAWSHTLKRAGPDAIMPALRATVAAQPTNAELASHLRYLEARVDQMQYPRFQADGWPIGSGIVESANKLVVEDRLKGAGMHWADVNVNPLLALRNAVCNDRWEECWSVIAREQRRELLVKRQQQRAKRQAARGAAEPAPVVVTPDPAPPLAATQPAEPAPKPLHPWKRAWSVRRQRELVGAA
jgi:hypothetical protein